MAKRGSTSPLVTRLLSGDAFSEAQMQAAFDLRAATLPPRPELTPQAARAAFDATVRASNLCCVVERSEEMVGMVVADMRVRWWQGREFWLLNGSYAALRPEARRYRAYVRALCKEVLARGAQRPRLARYGFAAAYPSTVISVEALVDRVRYYAAPDAGDWESTLMHHLCVAHGEAFDAVAGSIRLPTLPVEVDRTPTSLASRAAKQTYEQRNPRWRQGFGTPILVELSAEQLAKAVVRSTRAYFEPAHLRRLGRRARRRLLPRMTSA